MLTAEDLWDLPLTSKKSASLDGVAKRVSTLLKASEEESFVVKTSKPNEVLQLKLDVVKQVIAVRLEESEAKAKAEERRSKKQKILGLIAKKQDEELGDRSVEDLKKMLDEIT